MPVPTTADRLVDFPILVSKDPEKIVKVWVRVPTYYERDAYAATLLSAGVVHYSPRQIRDILRAGIVASYPPEEFDEIHAGMEEVWQVTDAEAECQRQQTARLAELLDVPEGEELPNQEAIAAELDKIKPDVVMDPARRARFVAIQQHLMSTYQPLQEVMSALAEQDSRRAWLNVEIYVRDWEGLEHRPDERRRDDKLAKHEVDYLRGQLRKAGFEELSEFITGLHGLNEDEEKNLDSLLESASGRIGLTPKGSSETASGEAGPSTDAPIIETPATGSRTTTGSSSSSTTRSATRTGKSARTRTGKGSSTSRSS